MKLYSFSLAPNAMRVGAFLKEKGIELEVQELDVRAGQQFEEPFQSMNPFNCVPFLELDNGSIISESISICRYLEEIYPKPQLFGSNAEEKAVIDMWNRRLELDALSPMGHAIRNKLPMFEGKVLAGTRNNIEQSSVVIERGMQMLNLFMERVDPHLATSDFIAGPHFTVADITGYFIFAGCIRLEFEIPKNFTNVLNWKSRIIDRDCFKL